MRGFMYMTSIQEKRENARRELELKRIQHTTDLELKRLQYKTDADAKKEQYKTDLEEKRAAADVKIDMDAFNKIVAELQEKHAAVLDIMVLDSNICVFSQKQSI
jgi:hypothetical protein